MKIKFSKACTALMFASVMLFTVVMIIVYCVKGGIPDELILPFFGFWGIEGGAMAWIKNTDTKKKRGKNNDNRN